MMHRSRRGAVRVNVVWVIALLVAFFVAGAFAWVFSDDATKSKEATQRALDSAAAAERLLDTERAAIRELSELIGYYDRTAATPRTQASSLRAGLDQFKTSFATENMGADVKNFQDALGRAISAHRTLQQRNTDLSQQVEQARNDSEQKTVAIRQLTESKDRQISDLRDQLTSSEQAARARQNELEQEVTSVRSTLGATESDLTRSRADLERQARAFRDRESELTVRLREMSNKLAFPREPERPDGQLLAVSKDLGLGWIDLGKKNRLFAGMSFRIVDARPGSTKVKAWAEVRDVRDDMAEVLITGQADPFDPPVPGDQIYNPLYDPIGGRNAVLLGRFSGTYNEKELTALLEVIGIHVQSKLDKTTDYLVVGSEIFYDEDGQPLEEPLQPSDTALYKEAESMGVQIVPLKLIRDYFRRASS